MAVFVNQELLINFGQTTLLFLKTTDFPSAAKEWFEDFIFFVTLNVSKKKPMVECAKEYGSSSRAESSLGATREWLDEQNFSVQSYCSLFRMPCFADDFKIFCLVLLASLGLVFKDWEK